MFGFSIAGCVLYVRHVDSIDNVFFSCVILIQPSGIEFSDGWTGLGLYALDLSSF